MPHDLLIEFDIDFASPLKGLLKPNEVIRNEPVKLTLFVTNLGTKEFPGGKVKNWRILCGERGDIFHTSASANVDCSKIAPEEKVRLLSEEVVPLTEGLAWIRCNIQPRGEDTEVRYYQDPYDVLHGKEWCNCFYVVNREMLLLISAMEKFTERCINKRGTK